MKKRTLLSLLIFLSVTISSMAQFSNKAFFYYKDGSVFIGNIVEENFRTTRLLLVTGDTITLDNYFVKRSWRDLLSFPNGKFHFTRGFFFSYWQGGAIAGANQSNTSAQTEMILGYRLNSQWAVGGGLGVYANQIGLNAVTNSFLIVDASCFNFYAYGRYYPWEKKIRPFASLKLGAGSAINFGTTLASQFHIQPGIGLNFPARKGTRFVLSLSQYLQQVRGNQFSIDSFSNPVLLDYNIWLNRTVLKFGVEFK
jgi:hypothetical protein